MVEDSVRAQREIEDIRHDAVRRNSANNTRPLAVRRLGVCQRFAKLRYSPTLSYIMERRPLFHANLNVSVLSPAP